MSLTRGHVILIGLVVVCTTVMGATHAIASGDITNIYIACLGSLSGHAVGFAAGQQSERARTFMEQQPTDKAR